MSGFVYIWFDRKHKRYYIGSHWGSPDDGYVCSSKWMKQAYKHRPYHFKRRILKHVNTTRTDLLLEEQRWLNMIKREELKTRYYNLCLGETGHWTAKDNTKSIQEKISKARTGQKLGPISEAKRQKLREAALKRYANLSKEERSAIGQKPNNFSKTMKQVTKGKCLRGKGWHHSAETIKKIRQSNIMTKAL